MARKKGSCLKRIAFGCGTIILVFVLLGFAAFISAKLNKPLPPERKTLSVGESIGGNNENALNLPGDVTKGKPVRLKIDVSMLSFRLEPHDTAKKIEVVGDYDQANYKLETDIDERSDEIIYTVKFKNKRTALGMLLQGGIDDQDINNKITVKVPTDLLFDIEFDMSMGEADLDFSGLAVSRFTGDFSMGEFNLLMNAPNQVPMSQFKLESGMGETDIRDFQNYRIAKGNVKSSMGEVVIRNSGDLLEPSDMRLRMTMGEMRFDVPPNAKVQAKNSVVLGDNRKRDGGNEEATGPELKVNSSVTLGSMQLNRRYTRTQISGRMLQTIRQSGVEAAIAEFHELRQTKPQFYDFGPRTINRLGYRLMRSEDYADAIAIFKLNVEVHPEYANGYDSLGEAYMKSGNREMAIINYEKSVKLDPSNENGHEMLAILRNGNDSDSDAQAPKPPKPPQND